MNTRSILIAACALVSNLIRSEIASAAGSTNATAPATGQLSGAEQTSQIAQAAQVFLRGLTQADRSKLVFDFDNKEQRVRWSNLPTSMVKRLGLRMGDLSSDQRKSVLELLSLTLSKMGYEKIRGIMDADEALRQTARPGSPAFGLDEFYISFLGQPSATTPWLLQFGGHHLALNITFVGEQGILTPSLIAVQPARYSIQGRTVRPLGRETDQAAALVNALDAAQRKEAILGFQMRDLVLGPGHDGESIQPEGIQASHLTQTQQQMLLDLIAEWSGIIYESAGAQKMSEIKSNLTETWFAWSGPIEKGKAAYFRIQGPTLVIEYAPQNLGGDPTQHIHTMYRDLTNDYGKKLLRQ